MSENGNNKIIRDGISQDQRLLKALEADYVRVDERTAADWIRFAQAYARELQYYNLQNEKDGDWSAFLEGDANEMAAYLANPAAFVDQPDKLARFGRPHVSLFLAFLKMLEPARDALNLLSKRHLDFYYGDYLGFQKKPAEPHYVHVLFEAAKNVAETLVPRGTELLAGKDALKKDLFYKTDHDIIVSQAKVADMKSLFIVKDKDSAHDGRVFAAADATQLIANPGRGEVASRWVSLGPDPSRLDIKNLTPARLGLAIASPVLWLQEGERTITLTLTLEDGIEVKPKMANIPFTVWLSTADGLWDASDKILEKEKGINLASAPWTFTIELEASDPPVVPVTNPTLLANFPDIQFPLLQLELNEEVASYQDLRRIKITEIEITTEVSNIQNFRLQTDQGEVNVRKPFEPFGPNPKIGSGFSVYYPELVVKDMEWVSLKPEWLGLPNNLIDYYDDYQTLNKIDKQNKEESIPFSINSYIVDYSTPELLKGEGVFFGPDGTLYIEKNNDQEEEKEKIVRIPLFNEPSQLSDTPRYFRFELYGRDFLHDLYPELLNKQARIAQTVLSYRQKFIFNTIEDKFYLLPTPPEYIKQNHILIKKAGNTVIEKFTYDETEKYLTILSDISSGDSFEVTFTHPSLGITLRPPYTPVLKSLTLGYKAILTIDIKTENKWDTVYYVHPFGYQNIQSEFPPHFLLPPYWHNLNPDPLIYASTSAEYIAHGELYIGLKDLQPPQSLSLLFQVAEGSANPDLAGEKIWWYYLHGDCWLPLDTEERLVEDTTQHLLQPGLLRFQIPDNATAQHTRMPSGLHWIKASVDGPPAGIGDLIAVQTQAARAVFDNRDNDPLYLATSLLPGSISKLRQPLPGVLKVSQPYSSLGGRAPEQDRDYYRRVSERLRHKQRAITAWDYERLVLEKFPEVYKAKCLSAGGVAATDPAAALAARGRLDLLVIPNIRGRQPFDPFEPKVDAGVIANIEDYLRRYSSPHVEIKVRNPVYERVRLRVVVVFHPGYPEGYYARELNRALQQFLSPWAFEQNADISLGNRLYASDVIYFIEQQPYVNYLLRLYMKNISLPENTGATDVFGLEDNERNYLEPSRSDAILVSHSDHIVQIIDPAIRTELEGIGYMMVEYNLKINEETSQP